MTSIAIAEEVLEATAKATFEAQPQGEPRTTWADLGESMKAAYREHAQLALKAAAPYVQAAEDLLRGYGVRSGLTREQLLAGRVVTTCKCREPRCQGLKLIPAQCIMPHSGEVVVISEASK
jgi:hypothetical protein